MHDCIMTNSLTIRPSAVTDADSVVAILNDLTVSSWLVPITHPFTHDALRLMRPDGDTRWPELAGIERNGEVIGGVSMGTQLGYYLKPACWGRGLGYETAATAVQYSFENIKVSEITAGYFTDNHASGRILRRLGFTEVSRGFAHCAALDESRPSSDMRLLRKEWSMAQ